jgi:hypothetical protein
VISHICLYPPQYFYLHPPSLSLLTTTLSSSRKTKASHPSLSYHTMIMSWHSVQYTPSTTYTKYSIHSVHHTPSTAHTKYSIHQVQHRPTTVYTKYSIHQVEKTPRTALDKDYLSSFQSHNWDLTPKCSVSIWRASLDDRPPFARLSWVLKGQVTMLHPHICHSTNWWMQS